MTENIGIENLTSITYYDENLLLMLTGASIWEMSVIVGQDVGRAHAHVQRDLIRRPNDRQRQQKRHGCGNPMCSIFHVQPSVASPIRARVDAEDVQAQPRFQI